MKLHYTGAPVALKGRETLGPASGEEQAEAIRLLFSARPLFTTTTKKTKENPRP
jgi:hypothetical protein